MKMTGRIFITQLKLALRNRSSLFWTLCFGCILGTLFYFGFGSIYSQESFDTIDAAVLSDGGDESYSYLVDTLKELKNDDGTPLLNIHEVSGDEAKRLLDEDEIKGIISLPDVKLTVKERGISESILTIVAGEIKSNKDYIEYIMTEHPELAGELISDISDKTQEKSVGYAEIVSIGGQNKDPYVAYFYNLIAMVCLFCANSSLSFVCRNQANISETGKRTNLSPVSKVKYELTGLAAVYMVQLAASELVLMYLVFILKINFGGDLAWLVLLTALGTLLGVSLGYLIGHIGTKDYDRKSGLITAITLIGGFFAGLFYHSMKIIMEQNNPLINRINPSAVITDAFYSLNIFGVGDRLMRSIVYLAGLSIVFIAVGTVLGRRQEYASL